MLLSISTIVYLYLIPHTHSITTLLSTLEIDCISVTSDNSDTNDDDLVSVTCSDAGAAYSNYIVSSCGYYAPWKNSDGSYLSNNICYAQNGLSGDYILAVAQCCDIRNYVSSCNVYESISYSGFNEGDTITQQCSSVNDEYLISCSSSTKWNNIEGYHAEDTVDDKALIEQQSCTAITNGQSTSNDPHGVKVHSHCCSMKSDYILECHQVVGDKSGDFDDAESYADCDVLNAEKHWFISSCHGYTDGGIYLDSIYIDAQRCVVRNGNGNSVGSVAVAQCCSIGSTADPSTTEATTASPSTEPTTDSSSTQSTQSTTVTSTSITTSITTSTTLPSMISTYSSTLENTGTIAISTKSTTSTSFTTSGTYSRTSMVATIPSLEIATTHTEQSADDSVVKTARDSTYIITGALVLILLLIIIGIICYFRKSVASKKRKLTNDMEIVQGDNIDIKEDMKYTVEGDGENGLSVSKTDGYIDKYIEEPNIGNDEFVIEDENDLSPSNTAGNVLSVDGIVSQTRNSEGNDQRSQTTKIDYGETNMNVQQIVNKFNTMKGFGMRNIH